MSGNQNKNPLFFIGVIAFFAIAILGAIVEFIVDLDGLIAASALGVAFLILAVTLIIVAVRRKVAEKNEQMAEDGSLPQYKFPSEQRFLRRKKDEEPVKFEPLADFGSFDSDFDTPLNAADTDPAAIDGMSESPSAVLRRRAAALRGEQEPPAQEDDDLFASYGVDTADTADDETDFAADDDMSFTPSDAYDDDGFDDEFYDDELSDADYAQSPDGFENYAGQPVEQPVQEDAFVPAEEPAPAPVQPQPELIEQPEFEPVVSFNAPRQAAAPIQQPNPQPAPVKPAPVKAAPAPAPAPVPTAPTAPAAGQSLESFYENMSEEDILYRDCVEVWAADAKPSVLRLIKYVESIEDKHTQALFGRDLEYVNAMIDRIYCFTQLEYVDELLDLQKYNFAVLVKECLKRFSPFFMEKRLGLLWKGLDVDVMTDRRWFIFALTQVIFNSVEFTPEGGKIAISAKKNDDFIDLMIDDSGTGISSDELPCVFIAGYMGDDSPNESGRRTGMGLFIAQSVLRKMGGDAFIESNPGKGTRVTLRVPANSAQL